MMTRIALALLWLAWPRGLPAQADTTRSGPLVTDRPDQTEATAIISRGFVQLETGWFLEVETQAGGGGGGGAAVFTHTVPGILSRVGLLPRLEGRIGFAGFQFATGGAPGGAGSGGWGDMELGFKYGVARGRGWMPEAAIIGAVSVPTGSESVTSGRLDPSVLLAFSHSVSDRLSVGYNLGSSWTRADDGRGGRTSLLDLVYTLSLGIALGGRVGMFLETFGNVPVKQSVAARAADGGFTWQLSDNLQLDASGGVGLGGAASNWFAGAGVSVRLPR